MVRAGVERVCAEFDSRIAAHDFTRMSARLWSRRIGERLELIHFHRAGGSYGAPARASVEIRVAFATRPADARGPLILNGPSSDRLRSADGRAYHLRFNALTWSTFERCVDDLVRVALDHGLPWFAGQGGMAEDC
ncbi:hypothetical protein C9I47_0469 [Lysobacter maris]|uniref:Integron gene cassette protein n=1 Tax=Marilutibacter maris TaxID=1605891 RepID=A0A2U9T178_9GAMM|nr:hypothetical protein C9I47_0469 [Lysobacter maris]